MAKKFLVFLVGFTILVIVIKSIKSDPYFTSLVLAFVVAVAALILAPAGFFERAKTKRVRSRAIVSNQPWEQKIQYDDEEENQESGKEEPENRGYREDGWEEKYEPIVRRVADPTKKRIFYSGGIGGAPIEELNLSRHAINFLLTVARDRDPNPDVTTRNNDTTPEQ